MQQETTIRDIPVSLFAELVSRNHTYLYSMLVHDFKGHLSSIAINLELLKETLSLDDDAPAGQDIDIDIAATTRQSIESIEKEVENIRAFMQTLLSNVEIPRLSASPLYLADVVRYARDFVASEIKRHRVKIDFRSIPDEDAVIMGDRKVMEQVFLNLLLHILEPKNRQPYTIDIFMTAADSAVEVAFMRQSGEKASPQASGYFRDELLVKNSAGKNFLDLALHAHGGSLGLDTRANHQIYTIRLPAIA